MLIYKQNPRISQQQSQPLYNIFSRSSSIIELLSVFPSVGRAKMRGLNTFSFKFIFPRGALSKHGEWATDGATQQIENLIHFNVTPDTQKHQKSTHSQLFPRGYILVCSQSVPGRTIMTCWSMQQMRLHIHTEGIRRAIYHGGVLTVGPTSAFAGNNTRPIDRRDFSPRLDACDVPRSSLCCSRRRPPT